MPKLGEAGRGAPVPGVLDETERLDVQRRFGVDSEQVARDHVISHALAAIARVATDDVIFFGGTALSRTHLADLRLSEDIDLIARGDRREIGYRIESEIARQLQRTFGAVTFTPRIRETRHPAPSVMQVGGVRVQIQLLSSDGYPAWPTELVEIEQRYSDAPPAELRVLTGAGFAASKLSAWSDRQTPRDLYDLGDERDRDARSRRCGAVRTRGDVHQCSEKYRSRPFLPTPSGMPLWGIRASSESIRGTLPARFRRRLPPP